MVCHPASLSLSLFLALDHVLGFTTSFKCQFYMLDLWLVIMSSLSMVSKHLTRRRSSSWSRSEQENRRRGLDLPSGSTPTRNPNPNTNPRVRTKEGRTYPDSPPRVTTAVERVESRQRAGSGNRHRTARWWRAHPLGSARSDEGTHSGAALFVSDVGCTEEKGEDLGFRASPPQRVWRMGHRHLDRSMAAYSA